MKKPPWRPVFYLLVVTYLIIDLKCCNGPLKRKIAETRPTSAITREKAMKLGWVALVNREPVTEQQHRLAVDRYLYQRGKSRDNLSKSVLLQIKRAVLRGLIDDILVRQYADGEKFEAPAKEIDAFIKAWENQFPLEEDLNDRSRWQGLSKKERDHQLGRIWSRKRWLERRITPGIGVTDEEILTWFNERVAAGKYLEPEKVKARHIFISTVEVDSEERENLIQTAYQRILDGEEFADVARETSEDERTKDRGGELNWMSKNRVSDDFSEVVFALKPGNLSKPFKTKIGWHIVEVMEYQKERNVEFEDVKEEIGVFLTNEQRKETIDQLLGKLRRVANIIVFTENI